MALDSYANLQTAIAAFLERDDVTDQIPDWIALAEARLNRLLDLRTMESEAALTGVVSSRYIALPAGFREPTALWVVLTSGRVPVRFVVPEAMDTSTTAGQPLFACIDGANLAFERPCDQAYSFTLRMLGALGLSDTVTTNQLLQESPDAYLYGALCEAGPYLRDPDLMTLVQGRFDLAVAEVKSKASRTRGVAQLRTEVSPQMTGRRSTFDIRSGW